MEIEVKRTDEINILEIKGRIDSFTVPMVEKEMETVISMGEFKLIADLADVSYISSAGLRAFISALKEVRKHNGDLKLVAMQPSVSTVFKVAGFLKFFNIYDTIDDAVKSF
ncbi:MAG: STAS domain-containing protein [Nitrospirota bacterium]